MGQVEPVERAAQRAVPVRRALAGEERQHDEPLARRARSAAASSAARAKRFVLGQLGQQQPEDPVQRRAGGAGRAADHVARVVGAVAERARRAGRAAASSASTRTAPEVPSVSATSPRAVAPTPMFASGPSDEASTTATWSVEPELARDRRAERVQRGRRRRRAREPLGPDAGELERARVPVARAQVEHPGGRGDAVVDQPLAGPAVDDQLLEADEAARPGEQLRLVLGQPAQLGDGQHRVHRRAGRGVQRAAAAVGAPAVGDRVRAPVHPGDHARERLARLVDAQHAVHRGREADRRDLVAAQPHVGQHPRAAPASSPGTPGPRPARRSPGAASRARRTPSRSRSRARPP